MPPLPLDQNKVLMGLGRAINEARKKKGMTQEELALQVELHETYISLIESGRRNPTWGVVRRISRALEVPLPDLVERAEELARKL